MQDAESPYFHSPEPGAALIVDRMPGARGVAMGLWFSAGSAREGEGERGLSHFVEHMVFKGAGDRDAEQLSRVVDREGGYLNAFTERDTVCLHCLIPAAKAGLAASVLTDMAFRPRFDPAEFEREKDIIANEIMSAEDDLEEAGHNEFHAMSYPGQAVGRRIAGTAEEIRAAGFGTLVDFHRDRFARGELVMTVAGDVDPEAVASSFAEALPREGPRSAGRLPAPRFTRSRRAVKAPGSQVLVFTGMELEPRLSEDEYWRMNVVDSAFGESMSSRLFMRLREKEGLCYAINSSFSASRASSLWGIFGSTSPEQFPRFAEAYRREAELLHRDGLSDAEVDEAASRIRGMLSLAADDPEYRMKRLARMFLAEGRTESLDAMLSVHLSVDALSPARVNALVRDRLDPSREGMLLYGKITRAVRAAASGILGASFDGRGARG